MQLKHIPREEGQRGRCKKIMVTGYPVIDKLYSEAAKNGYAELNKMTGISESTLKAWIQCKAFPSILAFIQFAGRLGYDVDIVKRQ